MARIRTIKPDFWTDEKIVELSAFARLLFIGLWNFADDEGRMVCSPKRIKMQILPADPADSPRLLDELSGAKLIERYVVDGIEYLEINNFARHQKIDKRFPSKLPKKPKFPPTSAETSRRNGMEWNGMEETTPATSREKQADSGQPAAGAVPSEREPDPELKATVDAMRVTAGVGTDDHAKAGELFAVLKANSCKGTPAHPQVAEWVRQGVTASTLRKAIAKARESNDGPLNPAYLAAIVERLKSEKPANGKASAWATDEGACEAKARELGLWPARSGESWNDLRGRIRAAIAHRAEDSVQ